MAGGTRELSIILLGSRTARESIIRARSVMRYTDPSYEIFVVSDAVSAKDSKDLTAFAASHPERIRVVSYSETLPTNTLYDRAAKKAAGKLLLFLDRPVKLYAHSRMAIEPMIARARERGVGPVGCLLLEADKQHIYAAGLAKPASQPFRRIYGGHQLKRAIRYLGTRTFPYDVRRSRPVIAVSGALLISRASFRSLAGFTDLPKANASQLMVDLCLRANRTGRQTWYSASGSLLVNGGPDPNLQPPSPVDDIDDHSPHSPETRPRPRIARPSKNRLLSLFTLRRNKK